MGNRLDYAIQRAIDHEDRQDLWEGSCSYSKDPDVPALYGTDDFAFKEWCKSAFEAFSEIAADRKGTGPLERDQKGRCINLSAVGRSMLRAFHRFHHEWASVYAFHTFHPVIGLLLRVMQRHEQAIKERIVSPLKRKAEDPVAAWHMRIAYKVIRHVMRHQKFRNKLRAHLDKEQSNFQSSVDLVVKLAEKYTKLLILRFDLYFRTHARIFGASDAANDRIKKFTRWLRSRAGKKLMPAYKAFILKREDGFSRGAHFHVMVILNGERQKNGYYLAQKLGEKWNRLAGKGESSFHNCFRNPYPLSGIGLLELDDEEKFAGLRLALHYLSKQDCILKVTEDRARHFRRSRMLKADRPKRGRPRRPGDRLSTVRRMLGGRRSKYPPGFKKHRWKRMPFGARR